jgi:polyisoprenoid-binding protein YceI
MRIAVEIAGLLAAFALPSFAQTGTWNIDPNHSKAVFSIRHMGISTVRGEFFNMTGQAQVDDKDVSKSQIEATIDATTVNTGQSDRDADLRSPKFLDTAKFPTMSFKSKSISSGVGGPLKLTGDLTIHGVNKEVSFDLDGPTPAIKDQHGNLHRGASATAKINRKDFGISFNAVMDNGGLVVGDDVTITVDLELIRKP